MLMAAAAAEPIKPATSMSEEAIVDGGDADGMMAMFRCYC
jgi:hypothetical protein